MAAWSWFPVNAPVQQSHHNEKMWISARPSVWNVALFNCRGFTERRSELAHRLCAGPMWAAGARNARCLQKRNLLSIFALIQDTRRTIKRYEPLRDECAQRPLWGKQANTAQEVYLQQQREHSTFCMRLRRKDWIYVAAALYFMKWYRRSLHRCALRNARQVVCLLWCRFSCCVTVSLSQIIASNIPWKPHAKAQSKRKYHNFFIADKVCIWNQTWEVSELTGPQSEDCPLTDSAHHFDSHQKDFSCHKLIPSRCGQSAHGAAALRMLLCKIAYRPWRYNINTLALMTIAENISKIHVPVNMVTWFVGQFMTAEIQRAVVYQYELSMEEGQGPKEETCIHWHFLLSTSSFRAQLLQLWLTSLHRLVNMKSPQTVSIPNLALALHISMLSHRPYEHKNSTCSFPQ